jgi:Glycosyltransferase family 87
VNVAQADLGFFPLIPLLTRFTHLITGFDWRVAGLVTTFVLGLAAAVAVWWMLRDLFGQSGADRGTALVLFSPGALVLSFVYSEAAVICFVACALMALRRHRWVIAGLCAAVATAADPIGSAAIVPCVVAAVIAIRARGEWKALAAPILAPLGIGAFFCYLWAHTGSPFEYFRAQRAGWQSGYYFGGIPGAFSHLFSHFFADPDYAVKAVSVLVVVVLLVIFFRARPPGTWIGYVVGVLAIGAISPVIGVTPRLVLRGFPLLGVVGAKLPPLWFEVVLGLSALCMAALAMMAMGGPLWTP